MDNLFRKKQREDFNQKKIHNFQLAHVLFSKEEGMSGDGKRKRMAGLREALQGAGPQALSFPGGISLDLSSGFCLQLVALSLLAWPVIWDLVTWLWASWALSGSRRPASLRAMMNQEDPPPLSWGVKGSPGACQSFSLGCGEGLRTGAPLRTWAQ